jgi:signal transduction histidine kinase
MGLAQENKKLAESLQHSNALLLEANEKLRKAAQAKYQFVDRMSHELRTPLNVIIGFSELMLDEISGEINEEQRQNLNDILSNGKRLLKLIDGIIDQFEVESGENR